MTDQGCKNAQVVNLICFIKQFVINIEGISQPMKERVGGLLGPPLSDWRLFMFIIYIFTCWVKGAVADY